MKLYLLKRTDGWKGYDYYDAAVVAAETEADALTIPPHPAASSIGFWTTPDNIKVTLLGEAVIGRGVVLGSYHAD